jgi:hypothetical protein
MAGANSLKKPGVSEIPEMVRLFRTGFGREYSAATFSQCDWITAPRPDPVNLSGSSPVGIVAEYRRRHNQQARNE